MAPTHPLEIPEIADLVASYLWSKEATACICVCKSWRDSFLPRRWRTVRAGYACSLHSIGPSLDAICSHRYLIQDLLLFGEMDGFCEYQYPNLRSLAFDGTSCEGRTSRDFANLIMNAPSLVDLKLTCVDTPPRFWDTLSTHPSIKHLSLTDLRVNVDDSEGLWRVCAKLESLQMYYVDMNGGCPENVVFDRIRQLQLTAPNWGRQWVHQWVDYDGMEETQSLADTPYMYLLDLVLQSPMLESLELMIGGDGFIHEQKVNGDWPHLKKLKITGRASDADLDFIFKNDLGNMADLGPYLSELNTSKAFGSHYQSLVNVDLRDCLRISSSVVPDILCLCPKLEILQAKYVYARNVAERGLWICQQLRELSIQFLMDPSEQDLQQLLFERLSTLVRLERLTLDYDRCRDSRYEVLDFRLDCGLGQLAGLQQLTSVWLHTPPYSSLSPNLAKEDVMWMVDNWKKLETVGGHLNKDAELRVQHQCVFESHGISVPPQL